MTQSHSAGHTLSITSCVTSPERAVRSCSLWGRGQGRNPIWSWARVQHEAPHSNSAPMRHLHSPYNHITIATATTLSCTVGYVQWSLQTLGLAMLSFAICREVVLFSEVQNVLWRVSFMRSRPLLGGSFYWGFHCTSGNSNSCTTNYITSAYVVLIITIIIALSAHIQYSFQYWLPECGPIWSQTPPPYYAIA